MRILILINLAFILTCCGSNEYKEKPLSRAGILDLRSWDFEKDGPVPLSGEWEFYWEKLLEPEYFHGRARTVENYIDVPNSWNNHQFDGKKLGESGYATYRLRVKINNRKIPLALRLPTQGTAYRLYLNRELKAEVGRVAKDRKEYLPAYKNLIKDFYGDMEDLEIVVQVSNYDHRFGGLWYPILLGTEENIREIREKNISVELFQIGCLLIIGLYHIGIFLLRKKDRSPLYFSIFILLISLRTLVMGEMYLQELIPGLPWGMLIRLELFSWYAALPLGLMFIHSIFPDESYIKFVRLMQILGSAFALITLVLPVLYVSRTIHPYQVITLIVISYIFYVLIVAMKSRRDGAGALFLGFIILFLAVINDMLHADEIIRTAFLVPFGLIFFIFSQAFLISLRFSKAFISVENLSGELEKTNIELMVLNLNLEDKVIERTEQLLSTRDEVETALKELEKSHETLKQTNRDLETAQFIMERDMEMAISVQRCFLPAVPPQSREWEISMIFRPMAGVSGDFYDYYAEQDQLKGIALFDVSGHGISSGLIAMIAKSLIFRHFYDHLKKELGQVMEKFNRELIREISGSDNYLTGILVRFKKEGLEFVNAGHSNPIIKRTATGKSELLVDEINAVKGNFLGLQIMEAEYTGLDFDVKSKDLVLIYTDCLTESKNREGVEFGTERLIHIMDTLDQEISAENALQLVYRSLIDYTGTEKLEDDLTIIMLKKK